MGRSFINRYQVGDYKCETRMNEGRKRNELPVQNTKTEGKKTFIYLLLLSYPLFRRGAEFVFRLRMKRAVVAASVLVQATRLTLVHSR